MGNALSTNTASTTHENSGSHATKETPMFNSRITGTSLISTHISLFKVIVTRPGYGLFKDSTLSLAQISTASDFPDLVSDRENENARETGIRNTIY
ncbi:hypothetical protein ANO14919_112460 [Xylariales sp. No.14919]|nr:hypothetical protein ANO14919_112460 [Xylariales sp. No.14919]